MNDTATSAVIQLAVQPQAIAAWSRQMLYGRDHVVIPVVALVGDIVVSGLGSTGGEFVPGHVLAQSARFWDGRPVVYNHPPTGAATANTPEVHHAQLIGTLFNARYEGGRLKADMWLDLNRSEVGNNIIASLMESPQPLEVSIGATVFRHALSGVHMGRTYDYVWDRIEPDHLAVLPLGTPGACTVATGCGAPRYAQEAQVPTETDTTALGERRSSVERFMDNLRAFFATMNDIAAPPPAATTPAAPVTPASSAASAADTPPPDTAPSVDEAATPAPVAAAPVFPSVADIVGSPASQTGGESTPVAIAAAQGEAAPTTTEGGEHMCVPNDLAGQLVANSAAPFQEEHRASLVALGEAPLRALVEQYTAPAPPAPVAPVVEPVSAQAALAALTPEQFLAMAPPEVRNLVAAAQAATAARRASVLAALAGKTAFTEARLQALDMGDLEALATSLRMSPATSVDYSLAGIAAPPATAQLSAETRAIYTNPPNGWAPKPAAQGGN